MSAPGIVVGHRAIAARLHVASRDTVRLYTRLERDPLTLRLFGGRVWTHGVHLDEWRARFHAGAAAPLPRLFGLRAIVDFVGRGVSEAQIVGWARRARDPFPLFRLDEEDVIFESAARDWCFRHDRVQSVEQVADGRIGHRSASRVERPQIQGDPRR